MKKSSIILIGLNLTTLMVGGFLFIQDGQQSKAMPTALTLLPGIYDLVGSADVDGDGQITGTDTAYVKACVSSISVPASTPCRGQWQQMTPLSPPDGITTFQKVGHADVNGDGKVTMGDLLFVKKCSGPAPPGGCSGELRQRRIITGRVVDQSGQGVSGVNIVATGVDRDGDPAP